MLFSPPPQDRKNGSSPFLSINCPRNLATAMAHASDDSGHGRRRRCIATKVQCMPRLAAIEPYDWLVPAQGIHICASKRFEPPGHAQVYADSEAHSENGAQVLECPPGSKGRGARRNGGP